VFSVWLAFASVLHLALVNLLVCVVCEDVQLFFQKLQVQWTNKDVAVFWILTLVWTVSIEEIWSLVQRSWKYVVVVTAVVVIITIIRVHMGNDTSSWRPQT